MCGWTLARAHAKSGDAATISGYLVKSDAVDRAPGAFALAYADQTQKDHALQVASPHCATLRCIACAAFGRVSHVSNRSRPRLVQGLARRAAGLCRVARGVASRMAGCGDPCEADGRRRRGNARRGAGEGDTFGPSPGSGRRIGNLPPAPVRDFVQLCADQKGYTFTFGSDAWASVTRPQRRQTMMSPRALRGRWRAYPSPNWRVVSSDGRTASTCHAEKSR